MTSRPQAERQELRSRVTCCYNSFEINKKELSRGAKDDGIVWGVFMSSMPFDGLRESSWEIDKKKHRIHVHGR
jgi:hypothetical protein